MTEPSTDAAQSTIQLEQLTLANWPATAPFCELDLSTEQIAISAGDPAAGGLKMLELAPVDAHDMLKGRDMSNAVLLPDYGPPPNPAPFQFGFGSDQLIFEHLVLPNVLKHIQIAQNCQFDEQPVVIVFTGYGEPTPENRELIVKRLKMVGELAEAMGVTLVLEHLNDKEFDGPSGPMMGHPGYMGHRLDWVADIVREVGSDAVKLLFDLYHVQIMEGQWKDKYTANKDIVGHVHLAQTGGRLALDRDGDIDFEDAARFLAENGWTGRVGLEFLYEKPGLQSMGHDIKKSVEIVTGTTLP